MSEKVTEALSVVRSRLYGSADIIALLNEQAQGDWFLKMDGVGDLYNAIPRWWRFWYRNRSPWTLENRARDVRVYCFKKGPRKSCTLIDRAIKMREGKERSLFVPKALTPQTGSSSMATTD